MEPDTRIADAARELGDVGRVSVVDSGRRDARRAHV